MKYDYSASLKTNLTTKEAMDKISQVADWWAKDFAGKSESLNDEFTVRFKSGDTYTCKVTEIIPNKKNVWEVIDAFQGWHDKHTEWVGTRIVWDIASKNAVTEIKMTHVGLVPEFECFEACSQGWNYLLKQSLQNLLDNNKGMPV